MELDLIRLSKTISRALRHTPWLFELELDSEGWVSVEMLLSALRQRRIEWQSLAGSDLADLIAQSTKQRFEMRDGRIRALYGHSLPNKLLKLPASPPDILYHGTIRSALASILKHGLKPMGRQYVHLSTDVETAQQVARRKGSATIILRIDAVAAHQHGIAFYKGNAMVWLADQVPPTFIQALPSESQLPK